MDPMRGTPRPWPGMDDEWDRERWRLYYAGCGPLPLTPKARALGAPSQQAEIERVRARLRRVALPPEPVRRVRRRPQGELFEPPYSGSS